MPKPGDKISGIIPVTPEFLRSVDGAESYLDHLAAERFTELCEPFGLIPVNQKLQWRRTTEEMRLAGLLWPHDGMDDDLIAFGYTARAARSPA